ncbi:MAG: metallopeptidase TldD-related protein [Myxococcota bacterium]
MIDASLVQHAVEAARAAGADAADALQVAGRSVEARVRDEEIEFVTQSHEHTLGLRAFVRGGGGLRTALVSSSDLAPEALSKLAAEAVAIARATAEDPDAGPPGEGFATDLPDLALFDPADREAPLEARIEAARAAERAARAVDPRIVNSEGSTVGSSFAGVAFASSEGFTGCYEGASHSLMSSPVAAENGAMQTDWWMSAARRLGDLEDAAAIGRRAAERALGQLGARPVPTQEVPVIFEAPAARGVLANLVGCLSGGAVYRKASFLAGRVGERIASDAVRVVDDGRRPGGLGSRPFDGEGQATRRTVLVENGELASYLLDVYSARKLGLATTGNASRGPTSAPGVGATNCWLEPGRDSLEALIEGTPRGLLVTGLFGQGFNPVTGDFSRGARGFWIEDGKRAHPVEEVTVASNLADLLRDVDAIANDLLWLGSLAAPSFRVARLTVGGSG